MGFFGRAAVAAVFAVVLAGGACAEPVVVEELEIEPVWAGHPVGFCLMTAPPYQYAGYYDAERRMTIARRRLGSEAWTFRKLDSRVGWDSHNYITMAADSQGYLHVAGNMHCVPLIYFRSEKPWDIASLERVEAMVGRDEQRCTYPKFFTDADGRLVFRYRIGGSGDGNEIFNVYDAEARAWSRLLEEPLTDGGGERNAYLLGPVKGPGGWFHMTWVWRETPDCRTNHDLSYARSRDLRHWETAAGEPLELPITLATPGVILDPVPVGGGIINGTGAVGFDGQGRVIVSYHKFDAAGKTQAYNARLVDGEWKIVQTSDWDYRWDFGGGGSIDFEIRIGAVSAGADGVLRQSWRHVKHGSGVWLLDPETLAVLGHEKAPRAAPAALSRVGSEYPGMGVRWAGDSGRPEAGQRYRLRWETLGRNRDRPHEAAPPATMLRLYRIGSDSK